MDTTAQENVLKSHLLMNTFISNLMLQMQKYPPTLFSYSPHHWSLPSANNCIVCNIMVLLHPLSPAHLSVTRRWYFCVLRELFQACGTCNVPCGT